MELQSGHGMWDERTDRLTDGRSEANIPPTSSLCVGYKYHSLFDIQSKPLTGKLRQLTSLKYHTGAVGQNCFPAELSSNRKSGSKPPSISGGFTLKFVSDASPAISCTWHDEWWQHWDCANTGRELWIFQKWKNIGAANKENNFRDNNPHFIYLYLC